MKRIAETMVNLKKKKKKSMRNNCFPGAYVTKQKYNK